MKFRGKNIIMLLMAAVALFSLPAKMSFAQEGELYQAEAQDTVNRQNEAIDATTKVETAEKARGDAYDALVKAKKEFTSVSNDPNATQAQKNLAKADYQNAQINYAESAKDLDTANQNLTKATKPDATNSGASCGLTNFWTWECILSILANILSIVQYIFSIVLYIASVFFDFAINQSIYAINYYVTKIDAINAAWVVLRDICNLLFLLLIMYIALSTVLQYGEGQNWKKLIGSIIVTAILINFSMAITKVVIDATNIFAVYFYEQAKGGTGDSFSIPTDIIKSLGIKDNVISTGRAAAGNEASQVSGAATLSLGSITVGFLGTILVMLVLSFVFFAGGLLFIVRLISHIFLLITSPLPWIGGVIPKLGGKISGDWWDTLTNQSIFAPAYMFCLYFAMQVIRCSPLSTLTGSESGAISAVSSGTMATAMYYIIILALFYSPMVIAKKMGAAGLSASQTFGKWATGAATGLVTGSMAMGGKGFNRATEMITGKKATEHISGAVTGTAAYLQDSRIGKAVSATKTAIGGTFVGEAAGAVYEKVATKAGMATEAAKEKITLASTLKAVTGEEIIPSVKEEKEAEKAEKEYKRKQELSVKKDRAIEISAMTDEKIKETAVKEKVSEEEIKRRLDKEIGDILENFRGDKIMEIGLKNIMANKGRLGKFLDEAQLKAIENDAGTKPEQFRELQEAVYNNPANIRGRRAVELDVVQRNWNATKKDANGANIPTWTDTQKIEAIRSMSSKNVADLDENMFINPDGTINDIMAEAIHSDDIKKMNEGGRKDLARRVSDRHAEIEREKEEWKSRLSEAEKVGKAVAAAVDANKPKIIANP